MSSRMSLLCRGSAATQQGQAPHLQTNSSRDFLSAQSHKREAVPSWTAPEEFRQACHISSKEQYDEMYKRSIEDPEGFWGDIASRFHWEKKVGMLC